MRRSAVRAQALAVALSALVLVLSGCAGTSPGPMRGTHVATVTPSPSPPTEPAPSPAPTQVEFDASVEPLAPPELDGPPSKEAAGEVAKYFMAHFPYIQATGDLTTWTSMSGAACTFCASGAELVRDLTATGQHSVGGEIEVFETYPSDYGPNQYAVLVWYREHPSRVVDDDGDVVKDFADLLTVTADMLVTWTDGKWAVESVSIELHAREAV